jgi:hypothetical protein
MYKNKLDMGTEGIYQRREQVVEIYKSETKNSTLTTPNKNSNFSLKSAFNTLSLRRKKSRKIKDPNISKDAEEPIYDVIDHSKMNRDSMKERPRLLTPTKEISDAIAKYPDLRNILNQIYFHENYPVIEGLLKFFDSSTDTETKSAYQITLKNIMESLKIFGENQELFNSALNCVLILSKYKLWDKFIKTNNEKNEQESDEGNYETIEGDYETIEGDYEIMQNKVGEKNKEKEPDYMNLKESNYMDMNGGRKPGFFAANTPVEKENKKAQQEESQIALSTCLN